MIDFPITWELFWKVSDEFARLIFIDYSQSVLWVVTRNAQRYYRSTIYPFTYNLSETLNYLKHIRVNILLTDIRSDLLALWVVAKPIAKDKKSSLKMIYSCPWHFKASAILSGVSAPPAICNTQSTWRFVYFCLCLICFVSTFDRPTSQWRQEHSIQTHTHTLTNQLNTITAITFRCKSSFSLLWLCFCMVSWLMTCWQAHIIVPTPWLYCAWKLSKAVKNAKYFNVISHCLRIFALFFSMDFFAQFKSHHNRLTCTTDT